MSSDRSPDREYSSRLLSNLPLDATRHNDPNGACYRAVNENIPVRDCLQGRTRQSPSWMLNRRSCQVHQLPLIGVPTVRFHRTVGTTTARRGRGCKRLPQLVVFATSSAALRVEVLQGLQPSRISACYKAEDDQ